jgi:hypothetical protein
MHPELQERTVGRSLWLQDGEIEKKPRRMQSNLKPMQVGDRAAWCLAVAMEIDGVEAY